MQRFDVGIIPFKKIQLTDATNPVKLFEYLNAGKSIVATDLNELRHYRDYVRLASSVNEWLEEIQAALADYQPVQVEKRLSFARQNTWDDRIFLIEDAIQLISQDKAGVSASLPLIMPKENLISERLLTRHEGLDYWCLVYEKDAVLYKQASFDLAEREARFLSRFETDYFPGFLDVESEGNYSIISFKKHQGQSLHDALSSINSSVAGLYNFIQHCLNMLLALKEKGVTHRNIRRENLLMQEGKPVLHDFGWAVSEQEPFFSPLGLGGYERSLDGRFSDVYSMGKIFEYVNRQHYRTFDWVISLMTMEDSSLRITDLIILKTLFHSALKTTVKDRE
ncbi:MAG: hypothetical protein IPJ46_16285 [Anaerolineales bacterium]|nr:hypothetical protein [Anaerolineales bacterium]